MKTEDKPVSPVKIIPVMFNTPGVVSIGEYQNGVTYWLDESIAEPLIQYRGFRVVENAGDAT